MSNNSLKPSRMNSVVLRYLFTATFITFSFLHAVTTEQNNEMACEKEYQENTTEAPWKCPALPNFATDKSYGDAISHELSDVNFNTGSYTCSYAHKDSGSRVQTCRFQSGVYQKSQQKIKDKLYGVTSEGEYQTGIFKLLDNPSYEPNRISLNELFNPSNVDAPSYLKEKIEPELNRVHEEIKKQMLSMGDEEKNSLQNSSVFLKELKTISYKHLVEPYYNPDVKDALKKEGNFANFLAGLVTLNGDMVEGYNEDTGEIIINEEWKNKATAISAVEDGFVNEVRTGTNTVINWVSDMFNGGERSAESISQQQDGNIHAPDGSEYMLSVSSWVDIFEMKLWGYYYNLQRRLDLGYDVIATQLLYIMSMWFILMAGTKTGIGHIINREQGVKVTEENWMKALGMVVGLGVFFISLPSPITSTGGDGTSIVGNGDVEQEMSKNKTIIKYVIRESAEQGSNFATMLSDLGLDAFLSFVVKKQNIYSIDGIRKTFQSDVAHMSMYYPAYETVKQCRLFYNTSDADFYNAVSPVTLNVEENWKNELFAKSNNISNLSYNLCKKAFTIVGVAPHDLFLTIAETDERINDIDEVMAKAVNQLVLNHIAIQDKMGWVNTFNTPVSYFVMKHGDMFLSKGVDYDAIEKKAKSMVGSLGVQGEESIKMEDMAETYSKTRVAYGTVTDELQEKGSTFVSFFSSLMIYNVLPAFSAMQEGIQGHFDKVYGDMYKISQGNTVKKDGGAVGEALKGAINGIKGMVGVLPIGKFMDWVIPDIDNAFAWRSLILFASFMLAIYAWKLMFAIVFISTVAIMLLLKTVLYFKDLMLHVITSVFVMVWAFAKQGGQGEQKMIGFARDTLVLMIYPSLIVLSSFTFIFVYEMFTVLYTYLMTIMLEGQKTTVSLMTVANSNTDTFTAYMNLNSIGYMSEILVDIFGLFIATMTIMQMPEYILKKLGINESESMMISSNAEKVSQRGEKFSNPL